jgi:hypothetical protein
MHVSGKVTLTRQDILKVLPNSQTVTDGEEILTELQDLDVLPKYFDETDIANLYGLVDVQEIVSHDMHGDENITKYVKLETTIAQLIKHVLDLERKVSELEEFKSQSEAVKLPDAE